MTLLLDKPSESEIRAADRIRQRVLEHIQTNGLSDEDVAGRLELLPSGVRNLKAQRWTLELAWRIAQALELSPASILQHQEP